MKDLKTIKLNKRGVIMDFLARLRGVLRRGAESNFGSQDVVVIDPTIHRNPALKRLLDEPVLDLYGFLRGIDGCDQVNGRILMPSDDMRIQGFAVSNWAPTVNVMNEILSRPEVIGSSLWAVSRDNRFSNSRTQCFYAVFFVPDPADPDYGDLYSLGASITNEPWLQNTLERNRHDVGDVCVDGRVSRSDATRFVQNSTPPFYRDPSHRIDWDAVKIPEKLSKDDARFIEGTLASVGEVQKLAL